MDKMYGDIIEALEKKRGFLERQKESQIYLNYLRVEGLDKYFGLPYKSSYNVSQFIFTGNSFLDISKPVWRLSALLRKTC